MMRHNNNVDIACTAARSQHTLDAGFDIAGQQQARIARLDENDAGRVVAGAAHPPARVQDPECDAIPAPGLATATARNARKAAW